MKSRGEAGRGKEKVRVRGDVASECTLLSPGKADVLYLPAYRRPLPQKPLFTGEAPVFTYKTLPASLDFLRLNLKWRFHTHIHITRQLLLIDTASTLVVFARRLKAERCSQ